MKRLHKAMLLLLCCLLVTLVLVACNEETPTTVKVTFNPNFDGAGSTFSQNKPVGATITPPTLTRNGYAFGGWYLDADCTAVASDSDFIASVDVTFYAKWNRVLTAISVEYTGGSLLTGEELDLSKLTVTATYLDEGSSVVDGYVLSAISFDAAGAQTVTVSYTENGVTQNATFTVTVVESVRLESITAVYIGEDVLVGEQPDISMLTVTAHYSNGTSKVVANFNVGTIDSTSEGDKDWEISYTEDGVTKTTYVTITVVDDSPANVADMSIHFITFGNLKSGDCIYIKAGDTDILIDAGSTTGSASVIQQYVDRYCTDGILEYVIVTHSDTDHIYAFTTSESSGGGIFERYECQTIIDFAQVYNASATLQTYYNRRDAEVAAGANHYTALECYNNENGAQRVYEIADGITMEILYHKYYEQVSSDNNNHSVSVLFTQGDNHYLFTGDLEEAGEKSLVESNDLPEVELFKAGHHGSSTSSNDVLLSRIKPKYVVASCVAGDQYGFPTQEFINRIANYTSNVFVTGLKNAQGNADMLNGNVVFSCVDGVIEIHGSNNDTLLKDTAWFAANRTMPQAWK